MARAKAAGRAPSRREFLSHSGIPESAILKCFASWNAALKAAGLEPNTRNARHEDSELLEDWGSAVRKNRKIPTCRAYHQHGKFGLRTLETRFGSRSELPNVFRKFAEGKRKWADVLALLPAPAAKPSPECAANPAPNPLLNKDRALNRQPRSATRPRKVRHRSLDGRPACGNPIDFRGLRHEPVNEQGVVLLFGLVAKELGYIVEAVQSGFPDCEAKRQIGPGRWQRVHIEFEFESRNFRGHGHPLTGCDVIVCWRHNWPDCPAQIEVLELSSLLRSIPASEA